MANFAGSGCEHRDVLMREGAVALVDGIMNSGKVEISVRRATMFLTTNILRVEPRPDLSQV